MYCVSFRDLQEEIVSCFILSSLVGGVGPSMNRRRICAFLRLPLYCISRAYTARKISIFVLVGHIFVIRLEMYEYINFWKRLAFAVAFLRDRLVSLHTLAFYGNG